MRVTRLACKGFRCLKDLSFDPGPGVNILSGDNAQGKTSVLEALLFLVTARSHRTTKEGDLAAHGAHAFDISGAFERHGRPLAMEIHWRRGQKRFKVNGAVQDRVSDILGKVHVVFFSPEDVELVRGAGAVRRRFLDMELSQLSGRYLHALQQYRQVLRQRNELLKAPRPDESLLAIWEQQLARHGAIITAERRRFAETLRGLARDAYQRIARREDFEMRYAANIDADEPEAFLEALEANRARDIKRGASTRGPHRDELDFEIGGQPARNFGSQGQQRTAALALKLAELELVRQIGGEYPVLMLDDVLSELDARRSRQLAGALPAGVQCILTATDPGGGRSVLPVEHTAFVIEDGCLERK